MALPYAGTRSFRGPATAVADPLHTKMSLAAGSGPAWATPGSIALRVNAGGADGPGGLQVLATVGAFLSAQKDPLFPERRWEGHMKEEEKSQAGGECMPRLCLRWDRLPPPPCRISASATVGAQQRGSPY